MNATDTTSPPGHAWNPSLPAVGGILALLLLVFLGIGLWGNAGDLLGWARADMAASYFYWREYGFGWMRRGTIPFWNPYTYMGNPFAANYEAALFYPLNAIFLVMPTVWAINLSIVLHLWMLGLFTYLFARRIGLCAMAGLMSAAVYTYSGPVMGRVFAGHISIICALAWWPAMLWMVERLIERPDLRNVGIAGLVYGMAVLSGHPQVLYYSSLLTLIYAAARIALLARAGRPCYKTVGAILSFFVIGTLIGGVQLLLTWFMQQEGSRQEMTLEVARTFSLPWQAFRGFLLANLFGNGVSSPYWGPWYAWETAAYTGIATLALAFVGIGSLFLRPMETPRAPFAILAVLLVLGLVVATGGPVFALAYKVVPGFGFFRGVAKLLGQLALMLALLAGFGLQAMMWRRADERATNRLMTGAYAATFLLFLLATLSFHVSGMDRAEAVARSFDSAGSMFEFNIVHFRTEIITGVIKRNLLVTLLYGWGAVLLTIGAMGIRDRRFALGGVLALCILAPLDSFLGNRGFLTMLDSTKLVEPIVEYSPREGDRIWISGGLLSPNIAMVNAVHTPDGYEPIYPKLYGEFVNATSGRERNFYDPLPSPAFGKISALAGASQLWPSKESYSIPPVARATVFANWRRLSDTQATWEALRDPEWDVYATALVLESEVPAPADAPAGEAVIVSESPNEVTLQVRTEGPSVVALHDIWASGWTATTSDGTTLPVLHVNHAFRGVYIDKAWSGTVTFRYRAPGFRLGLGLSLLGLLLAVVSIALPRRGNE